MQKIFNNLKVIELASVLAGPAVGMFFAELGATVIKVENKKVGGDVTRHWKLPEEDPASPLSAYYHSVNWHKDTHLLDLTDPADYKQVKDWLREADIVITNFKAGSADKLKLDYQTVRSWNPRIIYAAISAYGKDDPRPGFDAALQAETGWVYMNGEPEGKPCKMPVALIDILGAHQLKEGILLALLERMQTGKGREVHVSLFDAAIASLANQASNYLNLGHIPRRMGTRHPNISPYGDSFLSKDNKHILLATGTEAHFQWLCECLEIPGLSSDERFDTNAKRLSNRNKLYEELATAFARFDFDLLMERFQQKRVPAVPIRNLKEVFALPETRDLVLEERSPDGAVSKRVKTFVCRFD